jgi:hypothetical protein
MKYDRILIYTKKGNLLDYLHTNKVEQKHIGLSRDNVHKYYAHERDIQLVACVRWENFPVSTNNGIVQMPKCFCKIKCPVNPLPVKGEFELPSLDALRTFLEANGWELKQENNTLLFE